jgi:hypothetical protein
MHKASVLDLKTRDQADEVSGHEGAQLGVSGD